MARSPARGKMWAVGLAWLVLSTAASAATVDTAFLERPWPGQRVRECEVGRSPVTWRQLAGRDRGVFAGATFITSAPIDTTWDLATTYRDVGAMTPGVQSVRITDHGGGQQTVDVTVKVLWETLKLRFEVLQDPPRAVRFQVVHPLVGDYRGALLLAPADDGAHTRAEVLTWLKSARPLPQVLILTVQRMVLLQGIRNFLEACDQANPPQRQHR